MLDLIEELRRIVAAFDENGVQYALCGGLALAVHGAPRATIDIDLMIQPEARPTAQQAARRLGYTLAAEAMAFSGGAIQIQRVSKLDHPASSDVLILDLILATEELADVWRDRQAVAWEYGTIWVVDRPGLVKMKSMRGSGQDLDDIARLTSG